MSMPSKRQTSGDAHEQLPHEPMTFMTATFDWHFSDYLRLLHHRLCGTSQFSSVLVFSDGVWKATIDISML